MKMLSEGVNHKVEEKSNIVFELNQLSSSKHLWKQTKEKNESWFHSKSEEKEESSKGVGMRCKEGGGHKNYISNDE